MPDNYEIGRIICDKVDWFRGGALHRDGGMSHDAWGHVQWVQQGNWRHSDWIGDDMTEVIADGTGHNIDVLVHQLLASDRNHLCAILYPHLCMQGVAVSSHDTWNGVYVLFTWRGKKSHW